ncbi:MAG: PKD domain-containing protein, partial [Bacteroidia bacterium]
RFYILRDTGNGNYRSSLIASLPERNSFTVSAFFLDIAVDEEENIYICGATSAKTHFTTLKAHQTKPFSTNYDDWDGYIAKFDKKGAKKWVTYYASTANFDYVRNINVDKNGSVFVLSPSHALYINEPVSYVHTTISRFDSLGNRIWEKLIDTLITIEQPYSTWKEQPEWWKMQGNKMQLDGNGILSVAGFMGGSVYGGKIKVTDDAIRKKNVDVDGFLQLYNSEGKKLYSSYFGGKYVDKIQSAAGDDWGGFYIAGATNGNDIHTQNAYDTTSQYDYGYEDGFLARLKFNLPVEAGLINVKSGTIKPVCENDHAQLKLFIKNYSWKKVDSLKINWKINDSLQKPIGWTGFVPAGDSIMYSFKAPLLKAGTHKAKVWISNGDAKNDTITFSFTVDSIPVLSAGKNKTICAGEKATIGLAAKSNYKYQWSNASGFTDTIAQLIVSPQNTTTYYLTVTNYKTGCTIADSVTVTVNQLPKKNAGNNKTICAGETVQLGDTIRSNYKYSWFTSSALIDSVAQPIVKPSQTTSYYLTITDTTGCTMQDTVEVFVNPKPVIQSIFGTQAICEGGFSWYKHQRNGKEVFMWQVDGANFTGKADADSILVKWDSAGKYTVKLNITSSAFCQDSTAINVVVFQRIKPSFTTSVSEACINQPIVFNSTTPVGTSLQWIIADTKTDTSQSLTKAFFEPGIYAIWLKSTTVNGCTDSVKQEIVIHDLPSKDWVITNPKAGAYNFKAADSLQAFYTWHFGTGDSSTSANANYIYKQDGKYLVTLRIRNHNGCEVTRDTMLTVSGIVSVKEDINT